MGNQQKIEDIVQRYEFEPFDNVTIGSIRAELLCAFPETLDWFITDAGDDVHCTPKFKSDKDRVMFFLCM